MKGSPMHPHTYSPQETTAAHLLNNKKVVKGERKGKWKERNAAAGINQNRSKLLHQ